MSVPVGLDAFSRWKTTTLPLVSELVSVRSEEDTWLLIQMLPERVARQMSQFAPSQRSQVTVLPSGETAGFESGVESVVTCVRVLVLRSKIFSSPGPVVKSMKAAVLPPSASTMRVDLGEGES